MNKHDRYFAAQRCVRLSHDLSRERMPLAPPYSRRRRWPAFALGVATGAILGLAWLGTQACAQDRVQRHVEAHARYTSPCLDRAHLALSVATARDRGLSLSDVVRAVRDAAERPPASSDEEIAEVLALVSRVYAQGEAPEFAFDREFQTCSREEVEA